MSSMVTRVRSGEPERSSEKSEEVVRDEVKEYYGKILAKTEDLKTNACCTAEAPPPHVRDALAKVHPDVLAKYYGCANAVHSGTNNGHCFFHCVLPASPWRIVQCDSHS